MPKNIVMQCGGLTALCAVLISGCSNNPIPVREPSEYSKTIARDGTSIEVKNNPDKTIGGLDPAADYPGLIRALMLYEQSFKKAAIEFKTKSYTSSDGTALGAVVGVVGGLFEKSGAIYGGAGLAAASSLYSQRYQFSVQAHNYRRAYDSMRCLRNKVTPHQSLTPGEITEINEKINSIVGKLFDAQWNLELIAPDVDALKLAFENSQAAARTKSESQAQLAQAEAEQQGVAQQIQDSEENIRSLNSQKLDVQDDSKRELRELMESNAILLNQRVDNLRKKERAASARAVFARQMISAAEKDELMAELDKCIEAK